MEVNEIGSMTKAIEGDKDIVADKRIKLTIVAYMDFNKENYRYNTDGEKRHDADFEKFTVEDAIEYEKAMLNEDVIDLSEIVNNADIDDDDIKWEAVDA
jgi:hypothetical protein